MNSHDQDFDAAQVEAAIRASLQDVQTQSTLSDQDFEQAVLASLNDLNTSSAARLGDFNDSELERALLASLNESESIGDPIKFPAPSLPPPLPPRNQFNLQRAASIASISEPGDAQLFFDTATHLEEPTYEEPTQDSQVSANNPSASTSSNAFLDGKTSLSSVSPTTTQIPGDKENNMLGMKIGITAAFIAIKKFAQQIDTTEAQSRGKNLVNHVVGIGKELYQSQKDMASKVASDPTILTGSQPSSSTSVKSSGISIENTTWQETLVGMAMSEAAKLFDKQQKSPTSKSSGKTAAIQTAAKILLKLIDQLPKNKKPSATLTSNASVHTLNTRDLLVMLHRLSTIIKTHSKK